MEKQLLQIAEFVQAELNGDPDINISGLAEIDNASAGDIVFAENEKWLAKAEASQASAIIIGKGMSCKLKPTLIVDNPKMAFGMLMHLYAPPLQFEQGVHSTAVIGKNVEIGDGVSVQPYAVIQDGAKIGDKSVIGAMAYVGHNTCIGENCILHAHTVVYPHMIIGDDVILHSGVVIGPDGFGYVEHNKQRIKVPQIGKVIIEDEVEIGANSTVDRATLGETRIGEGTKIDNLVQVAHNDVIGKNCILCAQAGVSGSSKIGDNVIIAGQAGLADHVTVGDNVIIGAQAGVPSNKVIRSNQMVFGAPARNVNDMKKQMGAQLRLPKLVEKVKLLEAELKEIKAQLGESSGTTV